MTEETEAAVPLTIGKDLITISLDGKKIEIASGGDVTVYTNESKGVQTRTAPAPANSDDHQISFAKDGRSAAIDGVKIELADSGLIVSTYGKVFVKPAPAKEIRPEDMEPGAKMADGTIFAGMSPDTKEAMYLAPADETLMMSFKKALARAEELSSDTGQNYRVPSEAELDVIFNNRAAIGGLDTMSGGACSLYRSSTPGRDFTAKILDFSRGEKRSVWKSSTLAVRLVRN